MRAPYPFDGGQSYGRGGYAAGRGQGLYGRGVQGGAYHAGGWGPEYQGYVMEPQHAQRRHLSLHSYGYSPGGPQGQGGYQQAASSHYIVTCQPQFVRQERVVMQPEGMQPQQGYMEQPVGPLRWTFPQPPSPWSHVLDATKFGPTCPQVHSTQISDVTC